MHYRQLRHLLFRFLTMSADAQARFQQLAARMHGHLDAAASTALDALLTEGCALINETTIHARAILQDQASMPIMDIVTLDAEGNATEVGTLPLFPVISAQEEELFFAQIDKLTHWYRDFVFFVVEHGLSLQGDHGGGEG